MRSVKEEENLRLVRRVYDEVLGPVDSSRIDELFAPAAVGAGEGVGEPPLRATNAAPAATTTTATATMAATGIRRPAVARGGGLGRAAWSSSPQYTQ